MWQSAQDTPLRVDALAPRLEFRVLGLQYLRAGLGVFPIEKAVPVGELVGVVVGLDLFHLQAVVPGKNNVVFGPQ